VPRQSDAAPTDCPALHGGGSNAAHGRTADHQWRTGSPEPVLAGRDRTRRSESRKRELVELLRKHDVPLIEDDVYAELYYGQHAPKPAKAFDTEGLVLHCGSFAKSLAPGYRVGWVAA
nr:hypothetical protein [Tanacetum cinerariifolium]